ncbi:alpha/beta fold hydrolase [Luteibacter yeojuensis]|uniref:Alpha/beta fold hydrolase n=1 Tax=Luteibacter yeojuensis TaxID=345309 RepID=A0A7X5TNM7_9GAMM|nr:alpha/beta hydrolase [Luteibacter yeojuensis]NID14656.1 alpha/beta fold hydrolase [Luteibacter yeojuensis]
MLRRDFVKASLSSAVLAAALPIRATESPVASRGAFADVDGQHLFYSVHGAGKPLVLLHGGIDPDSFGSNLAKLAKGRRVVAVHLQAHGRTPDTDRPLRSETMGDDVAALIGQLKLGKADLMGYSLGAGVALQAAIRHPDAVDRLVVVSAAMRQDGFYPEGVEAFRQLEANAATLGPSVKASPLGARYPEVDWTRLFRKVGDLTKRPFDWSADVAKLQARTLLVFADADAIRPEHMVEFWKALGGGRRDAGMDGSQRPANELAILPGTTHYSLPVDAMLPEVVGRFLGSPPP